MDARALIADVSRRPAALRLVVVVALLASVVVVYHFYSLPSVPQAEARMPVAVAWEEKARPIWESFEYTALGDRVALRKAIGKGVADSRLLTELTQAQRDNLIEVLTRTFALLAAKTPDEYLEGVKGLRRMPDSPLENTKLLGVYKGFTGKPLTGDESPRAIFEMFWKGRPDLPPRPTSISFGSSDGQGFALGLWKQGGEERFRDDQAIDPARAIAWENPVASSMGEVTVPLEMPEDILARDGEVTELLISTAVRDADGYCLPIGITVFWSTTGNCWRWQTMYPLTDIHTYWAL